jgi:hypothetical protein
VFRAYFISSGNRFQPFRELPNRCYIIIFLDVPQGAGNRHTVQQFKEIKVQRVEQRIGGAV